MLFSYGLAPGTPVSLVGRFEEYQQLIGVRSKIAYVLGSEPDSIDLNNLQRKPLLAGSISPLAASPSGTPAAVQAVPNLFVYLPADWPEDPLTLSVLGAMNNIGSFRLNVITASKGKESLRGSRFTSLTVFTYSELPPNTIARMSDIVAFFGESIPGERMAVLALNMMKSGKIAIDCTRPAAFAECGAPILRGPADLASLPNDLDQAVLTHRREIGLRAKEDRWLQSHSIEHLESALKLQPSNTKVVPPKTPGRTLFLPTNGNGLGHARRCTLVAAEMNSATSRIFAAFPSCIPLVAAKGFSCLPLVQRSDYQDKGYANDLLNYLRLRSALRAGDRIVFDGGFVFESVFRVIVEKPLDAVWMRRGLWQAGQINEMTLEREKAFNRVIVPQEAFEELNSPYSFGRQIHQVGPIVDQSALNRSERATLREDLQKSLETEFDELIVTMLGSGVAADRSAHLQLMCSIAERRPRCLQVVVVWPNSKVSPSIFTWNNTRVVKTRNALSLCQVADLVVSASGYNSFHEILYHAIPSILIPQVASYMDDQEKRARAASDRGFSETVMAHELLRLEREIGAFLDDGKAKDIRNNLAGASLPTPGNEAAAAIIDPEDFA
jgi:hypothetical protein